MKHVTWNAIAANDEYRQGGDTHLAQTEKWLYVWGAPTLRRYGLNGQYEETTCRQRPEGKDLGQVLSLRFASRRYNQKRAA